MPRILIISDNIDLTQSIEKLLVGVKYEAKVLNPKGDKVNIAADFLPDIAIIDSSSTNDDTSSICKKLKLQGQNNDIQIILLTSNETAKRDTVSGADGYIAKPFSDDILMATVNAHLRIKKLLDILYTNNSELAKSLYQLNVLYNTSSQLAGTLDKVKLIDILSDGLEKSLSYTLCSTLVTNNQQDARLIIKSLHPISERLEQAIKLRTMVGYKSLFDKANLPFELSIENITVEKYSKHNDGEYDLELLNYDKLFAPISTSDKFFGTVELIRDIELTGEDSTCFQTLIKQVSLPLESAILYEEIKETNIKLEKLEKMKSEFISIVSHELRTPLTAIKNSLDIMLSGKTGELTESMDKFLHMAKRNVSRLSGIINDLLDLSKIEAGKMQFRFEELAIKEPIEFVKTTFENLASQKNIKLQTVLNNGMPIVYGDIDRIEQVLSNLVSNAIKFTPEGGSITVEAQVLNSKDIDSSKFYQDPSATSPLRPLLDSDYIKISVKDSGIGIKEEDIPKVFDKFQQIESSLSRNVGGTGLGLPIAKQLIDAHRGEIWIESEESKGTVFSFVLPVLNKNNKFVLELDNELKQAKYNHSSSALVFVEEQTKIGSIVKDIKDGKLSILNNIEKAIFFYSDGNANSMQVLVPFTDKVDLQNSIINLKEFIIECKKEYTDSNIAFGYALYPDDAIASTELIEQAMNSICDINTNKEPV